MAVAAPVILAEMADWVALGGRNSGIVGDDDHTSGFHRAANEVPPTDYSRRRDPNGADGPYVDWDFACAGDFWHGDDPRLLAYHRRLLARLERGDLPMICEFIGQPDPDGPVVYWSRWGGRSLYRGAGHGLWSHISWYRSRADQRAYLWQEDDMTEAEARRAAFLGVYDALYQAASGTTREGRFMAAQIATLLGASLPADGDDVDEATIVQGILAGLTPEKIAAAIPPTLAQQVADELARRIAS